ncbi:FAD binding domain-containing protein [Pisolithus tinctorius]|nr:FAD binding domain-containing protein [Pisolithus tinctorius]
MFSSLVPAPQGLCGPILLSLAGVNVHIVDQRETKVATGQADGIAPRTTEVFQSYGLGDRLLRKDCRVYMATFYEPSENGGIKLSRRAPDITAPSARYPFELALRQRAIESIFLDSMKTRGAEVQRSTRPIEIELSNDAAELADPTSYPVKVTLGRLSPNGTVHHEVVHAKFVLCADGAHSWVRNAFGIAMDLVLTGDFNAPIQTQKIQALEKSLEQPESFLNQYPRERFDITTISKGNKLEFDYRKVPQLLRPH